MKTVPGTCGLFSVFLTIVLSAFGLPETKGPNVVTSPNGKVIISVPVGAEVAPFTVYTRITTPMKRMVNVAEDTVVQDSIYRRLVTLTPGAYRLSVVIIDKAEKRVRYDDISFDVPKSQ